MKLEIILRLVLFKDDLMTSKTKIDLIMPCSTNLSIVVIMIFFLWMLDHLLNSLLIIAGRFQCSLRAFNIFFYHNVAVLAYGRWNHVCKMCKMWYIAISVLLYLFPRQIEDLTYNSVNNAQWKIPKNKIIFKSIVLHVIIFVHYLHWK